MLRDDGRKMYMCRGHDLVVMEEKQGATWQPISKIPADVSNRFYLTAWGGKLLLSGAPHKSYTLDLGSKTWTELMSSVQYSGHVQSSCFLEF